MLALSTTLLFALWPQEPVRIGLLVADAGAAVTEDGAFARGARCAELELTRQGAAPVEFVFAAAAAPQQVAAAVGELQAAGVVAIVRAPDAAPLDVVRRVARGKLPLVAHVATPAAIAQALDDVCARTLQMQYVGLVRDGAREAKELEDVLTKGGGLTAPTRLLWRHEVGASAKALPKLLEKEGRPHLLLLDAEPDAAAKFVTEVLQGDPLPIVLTPRAVGAATRALPRPTFALLGLSPAQAAADGLLRERYEHEFGEPPGHGAAEAWEGVFAVARAVAAAGSDGKALAKALADVAVEGARGRITFDRKFDALPAPLATWTLTTDATAIYSPPLVPRQVPGVSGTSADPNAAAVAGPQKQIGEPFGCWGRRQFVPEPGSQWVLCLWAGPDGPGFDSDEEDLQLLGLSTGGADPIPDHLVREEILARVLAIASTKYGRREDGTGIPGKSLRVSFIAHVDPKEREKKKQRLWPARFGGDHSGAGGEAFGTYCRVYTAFIRRTIFQEHALDPPLSPADRAYLDGSYVFGSDHARDKRSELIRALINGYAGSMALTLAHEVGHLCGLGHVTDDPVEIMNVEEGAGIDYRDAHFGAASWAHLVDRYGLVEATATK